MTGATLNNYIYTKNKELVKELALRRKNYRLRKKVLDFLGDDVPDFLLKGGKPHAFLSRPIMTANQEMKRFIKLSNEFDLTPTLLEYPGKFVARNDDKYHRAKMKFKKAQTSKEHTTSKNVVDFNYWEGHKFSNVKTHWNENICDFHQRILYEKHPSLEGSIYDITKWFNKVRKMHGHYYLAFYAIAIYHGVLFENYLLDVKDELDFFEKKALPSFIEAERIFGVKPLIYPVLPIRTASKPQWLYYDKSQLKHLG